ncbi:hypothetical protein [Methanoculleus sp. UBA303]|jgi:hypothetical protein|uniref:hypothetical protein n=1 Tax=Methanoculleus sp. UBA303 TaxID=1915497 RepID=UPI0025E0F036|nr:hypothetical protein [Methanoculleus sp. UBA303]
MNKKIRPRTFSVLLAVMLVSMVAVSAVSAQDVTGTPTAGSGEPALVIGDSMDVLVAGATSVSDMRASGVPEPEELNVPKGVTRYDLVTFDHVALSKQVQSVLPLRIHGKEYQAELHRMDFEQIDDGIDSYDGAIVGVGGSDVLLTTGENALVGSVTLGNETFWITPVESRARAEKEASPLHVIYSSRDIENPEKSVIIDYGTLIPPEGYTPTEVPENLESSAIELQDQYATVNLLVVTDNQFYQDQDNWKTIAQDIVAEANRQFDRDDILVSLCVMAYTDSRRVQLSNHSNITNNPVVAVQAVYPDSDLDLWASDLALYVGGYDADGSAQGATYGYYPYHHRHAWAQMVPDDIWYLGTTHGRRCVSIHELGHLFDTGHQDLDQNRTIPSYRRAYQWYQPFSPPLNLKNTVTYSYFNELMSTTEFSSDDYHGDADHDNARRIRETKWTVANYHS